MSGLEFLTIIIVPPLAILVAAGCALGLALWNAYVLTILWAWFAVPTFGLAPMALWQALGLVLIMGYLTGQNPIPSRDGATLRRVLMSGLSRPLFALGIGWLWLAAFGP